MLAGGRSIPFMVEIRYKVGLPNIRVTHPQIVDVIYKQTVLSILDDQYFPTSGSESLDGLSQSLSMDVSKLRMSVDKRIQLLRESLNGIMLVVC